MEAESIFQSCQNTPLHPADAQWLELQIQLCRMHREEYSADRHGKMPEGRTYSSLLGMLSDPETPNWVKAEVHFGLLVFFHSFRSDHEMMSGQWKRILAIVEDDPQLVRCRSILFQVLRFFAMFQEMWRDHEIPEEISRLLCISRTQEEHALCLLLAARRMTAVQDQNVANRWIEEIFAQALDCGRQTGWHSRILRAYASWLAKSGRETRDGPAGTICHQPDRTKALIYYQQLANMESPFRKEAEQEIAWIQLKTVTLHVDRSFTPGTPVTVTLSSSNLPALTLRLYGIDPGSREEEILNGCRFADPKDLTRLKLETIQPIRCWEEAFPDAGTHQLQKRTLPLGPLPAGLYVIEANESNGPTGKAAREYLLVTETALVVRRVNSDLVVFAARCTDGAPVPGMKITLWGKPDTSPPCQETTGADGLARFRWPPGNPSAALIVGQSSAETGNRLTMATLTPKNSNGRNGQDNVSPWLVYAFSDRPVYRPGETVRWKVIVREMDQGFPAVPRERSCRYQLFSPQGNGIDAGILSLDEAGTAEAEWNTSPVWLLGEYRVSVGRPAPEPEENQCDSGNDFRMYCDATPVFQLDEYRRPEFQVFVRPFSTASDGLRVRPGGLLQLEVEARTYFGAPLSGAPVMLEMQSMPAYICTGEDDETSYYSEWYSSFSFWDEVDLPPQKELRTDGSGKVQVSLPYPLEPGRRYRVTATVTDSANRRVCGSLEIPPREDTLSLVLTPAKRILTPGETIIARLDARDETGRPASLSGEWTITREIWRESWLSPEGKEIRGEELERKKRESTFFPPFPDSLKQHPWRQLEGGFQREVMAQGKWKVHESARGEIAFPATAAGFYRLTCRWRQENGLENEAALPFWVEPSSSNRSDYHPSRLELVVERDRSRGGETMRGLVFLPGPGQHVLFTVERKGIQECRIFYAAGKLLQLTLNLPETGAPGCRFTVTALRNGNVAVAEQLVRIIPESRRLRVDLRPDKENARPGEPLTLTINTRDESDRPVSATVALSVWDETLESIQKEWRGDPWKFFYANTPLEKAETGHTLASRFMAFYGKREWGPNDPLWGIQGVVKDPAGGVIPGAVIEVESGGFKESQIADDLGEFRLERISPGECTVTATLDGFRPCQQQCQVSIDRMTRIALCLEPSDSFTLVACESTPVWMMSESSGPVYRKDFRPSCLWRPQIQTGPGGEARVTVTLPDSLTRWRATAWAVDGNNRFGRQSRTVCETSRPITIRTAVPRFLVQGDRCLVSLMINNNTAQAALVRLVPAAAGASLKTTLPAENGQGDLIQQLDVPAGGEAIAGWWLTPGDSVQTVTWRARATSALGNDGVEVTIPVIPHQVPLTHSAAGILTGDECRISLDLPAERAAGSARLQVQLSPDLAMTLLDALPYLLEYPYGCVEQTLDRFLPAVIVKKTLAELGVSEKSFHSRLARTIGPDPETSPAPWLRGGEKDLSRIVAAGLERLKFWQTSSGGWSWWGNPDATDPGLSAYLLWGLVLAAKNGVKVEAAILQQAADHLVEEMDDSSLEIRCWALHALSAFQEFSGDGTHGETLRSTFKTLMENGESLDDFSTAVLALSAGRMGLAPERESLIKQLEKRAKSPAGNPAAPAEAPAGIPLVHWGKSSPGSHWYQQPTAVTAFALQALLSQDPRHPLAGKAAGWLSASRQGSRWSNTLDTAVAILALCDYLRGQGGLGNSNRVALWVNGKSLGESVISRESALSTPVPFAVESSLLKDGKNEIRLERRQGNGRVYLSARLEWQSTAEPIPATGNQLFIHRQYFRRQVQPTLPGGGKVVREPLRDGAELETGEQVDVLLTLQIPYDVDYLMLEDRKPAGWETGNARDGLCSLFPGEISPETVGLRLGKEIPGDDFPPAGFPVWDAHAVMADREDEPDYDFSGNLHVEFRDRHTAIFLSHLTAGFWEIRYSLRVERAGSFHGLPVTAEAMYCPHVRASGEEIRLQVYSGK